MDLNKTHGKYLIYIWCFHCYSKCDAMFMDITASDTPFWFLNRCPSYPLHEVAKYIMKAAKRDTYPAVIIALSDKDDCVVLLPQTPKKNLVPFGRYHRFNVSFTHAKQTYLIKSKYDVMEPLVLQFLLFFFIYYMLYIVRSRNGFWKCCTHELLKHDLLKKLYRKKVWK